MNAICNTCGQRWTGTAACHCASGCHHTFTSITAFDRHRRDGHCLPPATVGLEAKDRGSWTGWGFRGTGNGHWHSDSRLQGEPTAEEQGQPTPDLRSDHPKPANP